MTARPIVLILLVAFSTHAPAATPTPELQQRVRAATFEVVVPKPPDTGVTYERPLPVELIPFSERNDKYWSVGTAFAIDKDRFVSAAHVINTAVGGLGGPPALRDAEGHVYPISRVLSFSAHEDFVVLAADGLNARAPLDTSRGADIDQPVYAVGNALGEGVVIRDGLLTSLTPEDQDGRWKWLRYSAATSPGNSGGPLLDAKGRVIGVVIGKSPGENLNYALPIEHVLDAHAVARFDVRFPLRIPMLRDAWVANYDISIPLPLSVPEFTARVQADTLRTYHAELAKLLAKNDAELLPRGKSDKLLGTVEQAYLPKLALQNQDRVWELDDGQREEVELPGGAKVNTRISSGVGLFEIDRGDSADPAFYADRRAALDMLVRGFKITRQAGAESVQVTSLGPPIREGDCTDRFGRHWRLAVLAIPYLDMELVTLMLPTPAGYSGMAFFATRGGIEQMIDLLQFDADYFYVSYAGTFPQWRAFLARADLRPPALEGFSMMRDASGVHVRSRRIDFDVLPAVLKSDDKSTMQLQMTFVADGGKLAWDIGAIYVNEDPDSKRFVGLIRQSRPGPDAGKDLNDRWADMLASTGSFAPDRGHDSDYKKLWRRSALGAGYRPGASVDRNATFLYEAVSMISVAKLPRDIDDMQDVLLENVRVKER